MKRRNMIFAGMIGFFIPVLILAIVGIGNICLAADENESVNNLIDNFQKAYSSKNINGIQELFHHKAIIGVSFYNNTDQKIMSVQEWLKGTKEVFGKQLEVSDKLTNREIKIYRRGLATVSCDYDYVDPGSHQTGMDVFTLMKIRGKWKIVSLVYSGDPVNVKKTK